MRVIAFDISGIFWNAAMGGAGKDDVEEPFRLTCDTIRKLSDGYDRTVIAVDAPSSFRTRILPSYKGNRPERYEWQWEQLRRALRWCEAAGHHVFEADGFEADDVLMTVASWCQANNHECAVVSNDKDMQAVLGIGPAVVLLKRNQKAGTWEPRTAEQFEAHYGFSPARMPDFLALAGDASDNFKFFDGLGEKWAKDLLIAHGDLGGIWQAASNDALKVERLPAKVATALKADYVNVYLRALEIATPRSDVPIDCASIEHPRQVSLGGDRSPDDVEGSAGAARTNTVAAAAPRKVAEQEQRAATALAVRAKDPAYELAPFALQPKDFQEVWHDAKLAVSAGILPQWGRPEQAATVILAARERGIPAMTALQNAYVVKGRVGWSAAMLAALVKNSPECEYFEIVESTATQATVASKRAGRPEQRLTYTLAEAKMAGLVRSNLDKNGDESCQWIKRPATMLRWAAFREAARAFWPERTTGMYTPGEIRDRFDVVDAEVETAGEVS